MQPGRPFPSEAVHPPGLDWGAPIETDTLGGLLARSAVEHGSRIAIRADRLGKHGLPPALEIRDALPRTLVDRLAKLDLIEEERRRGAAP